MLVKRLSIKIDDDDDDDDENMMHSMCMGICTYRYLFTAAVAHFSSRLYMSIIIRRRLAEREKNVEK